MMSLLLVSLNSQSSDYRTDEFQKDSDELLLHGLYTRSVIRYGPQSVASASG